MPRNPQNTQNVMTRLTPDAKEIFKRQAEKLGLVYAGQGSISLLLDWVGTQLMEGETVTLSPVEDEASTA